MLCTLSLSEDFHWSGFGSGFDELFTVLAVEPDQTNAGEECFSNRALQFLIHLINLEGLDL
jgi:hypothetical protein